MVGNKLRRSNTYVRQHCFRMLHRNSVTNSNTITSMLRVLRNRRNIGIRKSKQLRRMRQLASKPRMQEQRTKQFVLSGTGQRLRPRNTNAYANEHSYKHANSNTSMLQIPVSRKCSRKYYRATARPVL